MSCVPGSPINGNRRRSRTVSEPKLPLAQPAASFPPTYPSPSAPSTVEPHGRTPTQLTERIHNPSLHWNHRDDGHSYGPAANEPRREVEALGPTLAAEPKYARWITKQGL